MRLTSSAFGEGAAIPVEHSCDGANRSPPLAWSDAPAATQRFALVADDPDAPAGIWVHWLLFNLPAETTRLPAGVPKDETLGDLGGARQGRNDSRRVGYGGPCPPPGKPHRYYFKLYALDGPLGLAAGATKAELEGAMEGHVVATAQLMGTYARKAR